MFSLQRVWKNLFSTEIRAITKRGFHRPSINLEVNQKVYDFVLESIDQGNTLNCTVYSFKHPSGLRYYHLDSQDILNSFVLMVNHTPQDNKGTSYVLQKMLQCGDKKYKVKDAAEEMKNRSFNSASGVETTMDYYLFPFQTKSTKDFYNLLDVYLNMAYNPRLEQSDFLQSRGRFNLKGSQKDSLSGRYLSISGGTYDQSFLNQQLLQNQLNQTIRKYFLGKDYTAVGKSCEVINCNYQDCINYHKNNFTLANSVFYTHGDMNPIKHIEAFSEFIKNIQLQKNQRQSSTIIKQAKNLPQTVTIRHCEGQNNTFLLSYKLPTNLSQEQKIQLNILSCLLFDFPESPFSKYLDVETPYPKFYGFRNYCFNIGFCTKEKINQYYTIQKQKQLLQDLNQIVKNGFNEGFVEAVMNNLESSYYTNDGLTIFHHISDQVASNSPFLQKLNIHRTFRNLHKDFRRKNIFENLIKKYLIQSNEYLRIIGEHSLGLPDILKNRSEFGCIQKKKTLSQEQLSYISNYSPTQQIQNLGNLPIINSNDYELFEQINSKTKQIRGVKTTFVQGSRLSEVVVKIDITDIDQQDINMLELYSKILPRLGSKNTKNINYDEFINKYISDVSIQFLTNKSGDGLKLYLFLRVEFIDYNTQYAFNVLNNIMNHPNFSNLSRISEIIMAQSSRIYSSISEQCMIYGIGHTCSEMNPFLKLQDKLFHARSFTSVATDIMKVANSRHILEYISKKIQSMHTKFKQTKRYEIFVKGSSDIEVQMDRYLDILLDVKEGQSVDKINIEGFMPSKIRTYFPNFKDGMVFEGFNVPYLQDESPGITLLGSIIHSNILRHKKIGGCHVYKGSLVSYIKGGLKEFLQLQRFYQNIQEIETGKRRLFQRLNSHTAFQQFKHGFQRDFVKHYKQAILATQLGDIKYLVDKYIMAALKQQKNSQVMMGPHLIDYSPLMKTGWTIQRILQQMSLTMQSSYQSNIDKTLGINHLDIV